jgi:hypothetical protein
VEAQLARKLRVVWATAGIGVCMAANRGCQGPPLARRPGCLSATLEDEADVTGENEATCVWF